MADIFIKYVNTVHLQIVAQTSIKQELAEIFTFEVPGAKFNPKYKLGVWDGKIRLLSVATGKLYYGLLHKVLQFAKDKGYSVEIDSEFSTNSFSENEANLFVNKLSLPFPPHDHQIAALIEGARNHRGLFLMPTASGKSLVIYLLYKYFDQKILIITPTTTLITQMASDLISYDSTLKDQIHEVYSGQEKKSDKKIFISTWQSTYEQPAKWFQQFGFIVGDEAHTFAAKSLITLMEKTADVENKIGLTGTLDGSKSHELVLEGLFGRVKKFISTKELQDQGKVAKSKIKCIVLDYSTQEKKKLSKEYQDEIDFLLKHDGRNTFISNLAISLKGNTIVQFDRKLHGETLYQMIKEKTQNPVYFIYGDTDIKEREKIRKIMEQESDAVLVSSVKTTATGLNIPSLKNLITAHPTKAQIRTLQGIGRVLRKTENDDVALIFDISDNLKHGSRINHTLRHFEERLAIYIKEHFDYKIYQVSL